MEEGQDMSSEQPQPAPSSTVESDKAKFAGGLMSVLAPVIEEMDARVVAVKASQTGLNKEIERLLAELELFVEHTETPPVQAAIQKLANARRRLTNTNQTLKGVHDRVERIQTLVKKRS